MMKKFNILLILFVFLFASCQSIKDGLSGRKNENSDEFLVQKKNPLVTPPNYMELPSPSEELDESDSAKIENEINIKSILDVENLETNTQSNNSGSAEDFVLKQIKNK